MKKSKVTKQRGVQEADKVMGQRIKARRNEQGMSQEELGDALGVSFQQVQKYEKGANRVSTGRLVQICQKLQCSISDLAEGLSGKDAKITAASQFAASRDGVAIILAMSKIEDLEVRRQLINLAEKLAA
jgi:transcriptional regulator with XRE-family HTH domain